MTPFGATSTLGCDPGIRDACCGRRGGQSSRAGDGRCGAGSDPPALAAPHPVAAYPVVLRVSGPSPVPAFKPVRLRTGTRPGSTPAGGRRRLVHRWRRSWPEPVVGRPARPPPALGRGCVRRARGRRRGGAPAARDRRRRVDRIDLSALKPSLVIVQAGHDDIGVPPELERQRVEQAIAADPGRGAAGADRAADRLPGAVARGGGYRTDRTIVSRGPGRGPRGDHHRPADRGVEVPART